MKKTTWKHNLGVNAMAALAMLGAALTIVVMFVAFSAEGARIAGPKDVSGLQLWLDASVECQGIADGTAVATWDDQSGNSRNATQSTGAQQPTCQTGTTDLVNGRPVIDFTDDSMTFTTTGSMAAWTIFAVYKLDGVSLSAHYIVAGSGLGAYAGGTGGGINGYGVFDGTNLREASEEPTTWGVVSFQSTQLFRENVEATYDNTDTVGALTLTTLGTRGDDTTLDFDGQLAELLVYNATLSANDRDAVTKLLERKWTQGSTPVPSFYVSGKLPARQKQGNCTDSNVALWEDFEEASGNLTVPSGCAAAASVFVASGSGTTYAVDVPDVQGLGRAVTFNGSGYFATAGDVAALDPGTSAMVVEAWVKAAPAAGVVVAKESGGGVGWALSNQASGKGLFYVRDGTTTCQVFTTSTATFDSTWHRVRATWNGSNTCTIQRDGDTADSATQAVGSVNVTQGASIGADTAAGASPYTGSIADLRVTIGNSTNNLGFNGPAYSGFSGSTLTAPTFTRATTSTRVNPVTGLVESVASGVPVVGSPLSGGDDGSIDPTEPTGVYVGAATTFALLQNENIDSATWNVKTNLSVTADQTTAPDGTSTADLLEPSGAATLRQQAASGPTCNSANSCTATAWIKSATGANVEFNLIMLGGSGSIIGTLAVTATTTWQKFVLTGGGEGLTPYFRIGGDGSWTDGEDIYLWRPQLYAKGFAVPLDPAVTSSAVTINADVLTHAVSMDTTSLTAVGWVYKHSPTVASANEALLTLTGGSGHTVDFYTDRASGVLGIYFAGSPNAFSSFGAVPSARTWNHYGFTITSGLQRAYLNGAVSGGNQTNTYTAATKTTLTLLDSSQDPAVASTGAEIAVYHGVLSPQQIRALYLNKSSLYADASLTPRQRRERQIMLAASRPLDLLWGALSKRAIERERIEAAKRYVASEDFPQPAFVMPQEAP